MRAKITVSRYVRGTKTGNGRYSSRGRWGRETLRLAVAIEHRGRLHELRDAFYSMELVDGKWQEVQSLRLVMPSPREFQRVVAHFALVEEVREELKAHGALEAFRKELKN